jgi:hypothetical protein
MAIKEKYPFCADYEGVLKKSSGNCHIFKKYFKAESPILLNLNKKSPC